MAEPRLWAEMTMPELAAAQRRGDVVLLPVGAIEQHGPHLPVDTDISGAYETACAVSAELDCAIVAPPVWWGASGAHRGFAGVLSLRHETLYSLLLDLCSSILDQGFAKLVLVVGHATNKPVAALILDRLASDRGAGVMQLNYLELARETFQRIRVSESGDSHAGELETAVQMYLRPGRIDPSGVPAHPIDPARDLGHSAARGAMFGAGEVAVGFRVADRFPTGVMGHPAVATGETGAAVWAAIVERACRLVREYHGAEVGSPA